MYDPESIELLRQNQFNLKAGVVLLLVTISASLLFLKLDGLSTVELTGMWQMFRLLQEGVKYIQFAVGIGAIGAFLGSSYYFICWKINRNLLNK